MESIDESMKCEDCGLIVPLSDTYCYIDDDGIENLLCPNCLDARFVGPQTSKLALESRQSKRRIEREEKKRNKKLRSRK